MIKKDDLLRLLEDCIKTEESAIPIYTKHISNTVFLSEFAEKERSDILQTLSVLSIESERHAKIFDAVIKMVRKADRDVF